MASDEFSEFSGFSELNALGNPRKIEVKTADGGRAGTGPIGNTYPAGIVAEGINIDVGPKDEYGAVRKGMSTRENKSTLKTMSGRK